MVNPILSKLNTMARLPQQMQQLISAAKSKNPMMMLSQIASRNPQAKQVIDMIQQSGKNPQDLFYGECQRKGVDPQQILNMFK